MTYYSGFGLIYWFPDKKIFKKENKPIQAVYESLIINYLHQLKSAENFPDQEKERKYPLALPAPAEAQNGFMEEVVDRLPVHGHDATNVVMR